MDKQIWPECIRPSGKGLRIRIWSKGKCIHSETISCDPYSKADLKSAIERRDYLQNRVKLGLPLFHGEQTALKIFAEEAQAWLDQLSVAAETRRNYVRELNCYWMPVFENWICSEITDRDIKKRLANLTTLNWKSKKNCLTPLRGVLDYAGVNPNPALAVKVKPGQKPKVERYTPAERSTLISRLEGHYKAFFAILFGCGLRPCEAIALTWEDWDGEKLYVCKDIVRGRVQPTKTYESRYVYVPTWVRPYITALPSRFKGEWLFLNAKGSHYHDHETINKYWKKAHDHPRKSERIKYRRPYTCRHTRAAELLSSGSSDYARMAEQMGHSLEMFLNIYSEFIEEYSTNDMSIFEGIGLSSNEKTKKL